MFFLTLSRFSGIIGNTQRSDGTVIGVCVNLSARFMCHPLCEGSILCDEETFHTSKQHFAYFNDNPQSISVKGTSHPVNVYKPVIQNVTALENTKAANKLESKSAIKCSMIGRGDELENLSECIYHWNQNYMTNLANLKRMNIITGSSGYGKSTLVSKLNENVLNHISEITDSKLIIWLVYIFSVIDFMFITF